MKVNTRRNAFCIHLLISLAILAILLSVIFFFWYPNDLIHTGGIDGLKILFSVDMVLGPLLTLIVFSPNKKGLAFDLTLIGLLQIACLCAGLWIIYNQRPVLEVIADDGVHVVSASDSKQYQIDLKKIPGSYPKKVLIKLPDDENSWSAIKFASELADSKPFSTRQDLYIPLNSLEKSTFDRRIATIESNSPRFSALNQENTKTTLCTWVPLISVHTNGVYACISKERGVEQLSNSFF